MMSFIIKYLHIPDLGIHYAERIQNESVCMKKLSLIHLLVEISKDTQIWARFTLDSRK